MIGIFDQNRLLTAKEVATILGVKASTLSKWVFEKKIPFVKFGPGKKSMVKFNPQRLNEWIIENSREPESGADREKKHRKTRKANKRTIERFNRFASNL